MNERRISFRAKYRNGSGIVEWSFEYLLSYVDVFGSEKLHSEYYTGGTRRDGWGAPAVRLVAVLSAMGEASQHDKGELNEA